MGKDNKKQGYNTNKGKNIKKESPHSQRGGNAVGQKGRQQRGGSQGRDSMRKNNATISMSGSSEFELPPMKPRTVPPPPVSSHPTGMTASKKVQQARPEQVQEVVTHLKAL